MFSKNTRCARRLDVSIGSLPGFVPRGQIGQFRPSLAEFGQAPQSSTKWASPGRICRQSRTSLAPGPARRSRPRHDSTLQIRAARHGSSVALCKTLAPGITSSGARSRPCLRRGENSAPHRVREELSDDLARSRRHCRRAVCGRAALVFGAGVRRRRKDLPQQRACRQRDQARRADQIRRRHAEQAAAANSPRRRRRVRQERFPRRHGAARPDRVGGADRQHDLAAAGPHRHANPPGGRRREAPAAGTRFHRRLHRLSANVRAAARRPTALPSWATCWRSANCGGRRSTPCGCRWSCAKSADVRGQYERLREAHGFRVLDYSVDADTASPRACFQFSEDLPARTDFSPFVVLAGTDKPALSAADKQLCVEGLQHGSGYNVTLARRIALDRARDVVEVGGLLHLYARPQARGAFLLERLRAAAHRAARHSGDLHATPARSRSRFSG